METSPDAGARILVVDDDAGIRELLCDYLGRQGFTTRAAADGQAMDREIHQQRPDVVLLDLMLPGEDGLSICRRLSDSGVGVIMLSAMGEETDRIVGLELGADDYLGKPCNPRELLARVKALLRRRRWPTENGGVLVFRGWRLDLVARELRDPQGTGVAISGGEFALLRAFAERPGRVLTRDQLLDLSRGPTAETFDRAVDVQVSRLRRKLADGGEPELIQTVRGEGYVFRAEVRRL